MTPLYGHTSPETAYVIDDYPYGFRLRCRFRCWLEFKPSKGYRFVSQTTNPKLAYEKWNTPKASTYTEMAACMYLDDEQKVHWTGVGGYTPTIEILKFVLEFPGADFTSLRQYAASRTNPNGLLAKLASGAVTEMWSVNGVRQEKSEGERAREREEYAASLAVWMQIAAKVGVL